jgi:hypothetical protein
MSCAAGLAVGLRIASTSAARSRRCPTCAIVIDAGDHAVECHGAVVPPADPKELLGVGHAVRPLAK